MIKRYWVPVLCSGLFLANGIAIDAHAQASVKASVQSHVAAAKNAAYEPGNDLSVLYDTVCGPALSASGPKEPHIQGVPETRAQGKGPRAEWRTDRGTAFA